MNKIKKTDIEKIFFKFKKQYEEKKPVYYVNGVHCPKKVIICSIEDGRYKIKYNQELFFNNKKKQHEIYILADEYYLFETIELANDSLNNNNKWKCKNCPLLLNKHFDDRNDLYCELCIHYRRKKGISDDETPGNELLYDYNKKQHIVRIGTTSIYQFGKKQKPVIITVTTNTKYISNQ